MDKYEKIITEDGSISFYNKEIGDIYHSRIGAYTEALEKFVKPSGILQKLNNYTDINVFDVCFGLGYNSKVLISSINNLNPAIKIHITAIEIDPEILLKSLETDFTGYPINLKHFFDEFLHKVYYTTISNRYSSDHAFTEAFENLSITISVNDARQVIQTLKASFDIILLDPFSPSKSAELWTYDFFKHLYRLKSPEGVLLTYSSSSGVRSGLIEAGFFLGNTEPVGRKSPGTIACKNKNQVKLHLTEYEYLLLNTTSGIPYYDPDLKWTSVQIHAFRNNLQRKSDKPSASSIKQSYKS